MKNINAYTVGLVFRKGAFKRMITEGRNWISIFEDVIVYDMTKQFISPIDLNILLKDEKVANALEIVEVKDNEIAFSALFHCSYIHQIFCRYLPCLQ